MISSPVPAHASADSDVEPIPGLSFVESDAANRLACVISKSKAEKNVDFFHFNLG